jgi:hypothetical protein
MSRFADLARAFAAGLFVFAGVMALVAAFGALGWMKSGSWLWKAAFLVAAGALYPLALYLFNRKGTRVFTRSTPAEALADLERRGLLVDTRFEATRAFGVESYDDEGPHYFLELADGSGVLSLVGDYLYDYEPIDDEPELNQSRRFPCTVFTVRRHRVDAYVVDVICDGAVIEPEVMAPGRAVKAWFRDDFVPEDGEVLTGTSFAELKRRLTGVPG